MQWEDQEYIVGLQCCPLNKEDKNKRKREKNLCDSGSCKRFDSFLGVSFTILLVRVANFKCNILFHLLGRWTYYSFRSAQWQKHLSRRENTA